MPASESVLRRNEIDWKRQAAASWSASARPEADSARPSRRSSMPPGAWAMARPEKHLTGGKP